MDSTREMKNELESSCSRNVKRRYILEH